MITPEQIRGVFYNFQNENSAFLKGWQLTESPFGGPSMAWAGLWKALADFTNEAVRRAEEKMKARCVAEICSCPTDTGWDARSAIDPEDVEAATRVHIADAVSKLK